MYIYIICIRVLGHSLSRTCTGAQSFTNFCLVLAPRNSNLDIYFSRFHLLFSPFAFLSGADLSFSFFLFPFFFFVRCWHLGEDVEDCAVLSAVAAGRISETRYASYAHMILEHFPHVSS